MSLFDPQDLPGRANSSYRQVNNPSPLDTAIAVVNPDGTTIGGGGGSTTANQGTPNTIGNAWPVKVTDGVHTAAVTAASAVQVDGSAVTQPISAASLPLPTGASTAANQTSGNTTLSTIASNQTNGTQHTIVDSGSISVSNFPATQPVSGTVTANAGTGTFTVGQVTGSNLHAVLDSGSTTDVTQATASNLNATVVQSTGSNLHTVVDSGSISVSNFPASQVVKQNAARGNFTDNQITLTTTAETTLLPANATKFLDVTHVVITNSSATAVSVTLRDGTAGTIRAIVDIAANGGATVPFFNPLEQAVVNNNWTAQLSTGVSSVHVFAQAVLH